MTHRQAGALDRVTRAARAWGLWLALVLVAAHSIAVWHAFTHEPAEPTTSRSDKQLVHAEHCGLCVLVASMGGAAAAHPILPLHQFAQRAPGLLPKPEHLTPPQRRPYAIRAPPVAYS